MDGSTKSEKNFDKAATLKNCLVYLLKDAKQAELGWCALHLKIAISELNNVLDDQPPGVTGNNDLALCGHPGVSRSGP